jgi:hypothetical protein
MRTTRAHVKSVIIIYIRNYYLHKLFFTQEFWGGCGPCTLLHITRWARARARWARARGGSRGCRLTACAPLQSRAQERARQCSAFWWRAPTGAFQTHCPAHAWARVAPCLYLSFMKYTDFFYFLIIAHAWARVALHGDFGECACGGWGVSIAISYVNVHFLCRTPRGRWGMGRFIHTN